MQAKKNESVRSIANVNLTDSSKFNVLPADKVVKQLRDQDFE